MPLTTASTSGSGALSQPQSSTAAGAAGAGLLATVAPACAKALAAEAASRRLKYKTLFIEHLWVIFGAVSVVVVCVTFRSKSVVSVSLDPPARRRELFPLGVNRHDV